MYKDRLEVKSVADENIIQNTTEAEAWKLIQQGNKLSDNAATKDGAEADRLYEQAYEKFEAALKLLSEEPSIYFNWAIALSDQAVTKEGEESDRLFQAAYDKYKAALDIEQSDGEVWHNWGVALMDQAEIKGGEDSRRLLGEAREKLMQADELASEYSAYVLAALSLIEGNEDEAREWLEESLDKGDLAEITDRDYMESDPLFESVKDTEWFKDILDELE